MDPMPRLLLAAATFCLVAPVTFVVGLQFMPATGADYWNSVGAMGMLGVIVLALTYGPLLLVSVLMGGAFAAYVHGRLKPAP